MNKITSPQQGAKTSRREYGTYCCKFTLCMVESDFGSDVDVGDSVTIGEAKGFVWFEIFCHAFKTTSGSSIFTGVYKGYFPWLCIMLVDLHAVVLHVERYVGHVKKIVGKVFFNDISFVAAAYNKVVYAVSGVELHDVPEDWFASYFDHGFWLEVRLFGDSRPQASCENDCFHV